MTSVKAATTTNRQAAARAKETWQMTAATGDSEVVWESVANAVLRSVDVHDVADELGREGMACGACDETDAYCSNCTALRLRYAQAITNYLSFPTPKSAPPTKARKRTPNTKSVLGSWLRNHPFPLTTDYWEQEEQFYRWLAEETSSQAPTREEIVALLVQHSYPSLTLSKIEFVADKLLALMGKQHD